MKKYIYIAVAGILALSACSKIDDNQNAPRQMTFTAGFGDDATTRATLDGSTKKVKFDYGDDISILSASNNNVKFTTTGADYGASATFTGTAVAGDPKYYAIYPYDSNLTLDGDVIKNVRIFTSQNPSFGHNWDVSSPIAYATTTGSTLTFHNACALLKVHNDTADYLLIIIQCMGEGVLTGTFNLNTTTGALTVQEGEECNYVWADPVSNGETIYFAVAPGTVEDLNATWENPYASDMGSKIKTGEVTFEAGKIYDLGNTSDWY